jgi:hypothetical protein
MDGFHATGKTPGALDVFVCPERSLATPPGHVLNQFLFTPEKFGFRFGTVLNVAQGVRDKPMPAEMGIGVDTSRLKGRPPVVIAK